MNARSLTRTALAALAALAAFATPGPAACAGAQEPPSTPTRTLQEFRRAAAARDSGRFEDAGARFDRVARSSSALRQDAYREAAAAFVKAGRLERAMDEIAAAVRSGLHDERALVDDSALAPLHEARRWPETVRRVRRNEAAYRRLHADPDRAPLITRDIAHLVAMRPLPAGDGAQPLRIARVEHDYIDRGSDGLVQFIALGKIRDADILAGTMGALPRFYGSLAALHDAISTETPRIRAAFRRMQALYPDTYFPNVYFVVGHFRSGGTSTASGLIIGSEIYSRTPGVVLDEIPAESRGIFQPVGEIATVVVHELTHFQQPSRPQSPSLLEAAILEGTADFVASLVFPDAPEPEYRRWGFAHDDQVRSRFAAEMHGTDLSAWIANNDRATADWPAPLGYYVGYRIAKGYYERATDKRSALRDLMRLERPDEILRDSGYLP